MTIDLEKIKSPADLKKIPQDQLPLLSEELRGHLMAKLAAHGGHVGPNLGVVEATVALHYVFDAPKDEIVFDVSHQSYVHKMLTGRIDAFLDPAKYDDVSGYTCPEESPEYDLFEIGHTSTSISLANGLAKARDLEGGKQNVVAFIGDAALGGGMALEGLDYGPELHSNLIIILNDNQMSIAENHGELYNHLRTLRESNGTAPNNIFKALGYEYVYVEEGNDVEQLIKAFRRVKDADHAVLVHINTMKGMGLPVAETNKEKFHWSVPFDLQSGTPSHISNAETYVSLFTEHMMKKMREDKTVVTMTAGTPGAIGFSALDRKESGRQFVDVGIAEQNCVTMAAGLAKGGAKPLMGVMATFIQRAYDQISHDIAINNLPVVIVDFSGSVFGINDMTHLGFFDVAMISNIPNILMIAPATKEEYLAMIDWALEQRERPVVIRTASGPVISSDRPVNMDFTKYDIVREGKDVAIIGEGYMLQTALKAADLLKEKGVDATVINPRLLSGVDAETLDKLAGYKKVITIDDGIIDGAMGQKIAAYLATKGVPTVCVGLKKEFADRYDPQELLKANGMTPEQIAELIVN